MSVFFFQAEDGIRDHCVTGVQTCALPIFSRKTGTRWRLGRTITLPDGRKRHYAPVINRRRREISPRYLCEDERVRIGRSEEHTSELQSHSDLVCRLLLEKKKKK